jgi:hypothetical protein
MSEPTPEHIDAVAAGIGADFPDWSHAHARALLTSTDAAVLDAMQDALVRAGRLREVSHVDFDIVADDRGGKVFQHGGDDPWRLRQALADHPERYRPGSRVERCISRWLTTETAGEWERWELTP